VSPDRALRPLRILTWHVHGSYLLYLSRIPHEIVVPAKPGRPHRYGGLTDNFTWPANLREVPADDVRDLELDAILFQTRANWDVDQFEILSEAQRRLPRLYLEHDPPREHPTDTRHWVDDPEVLLVHVTHFNDLMWDSGRTPTRVVEHGVVVTDEIEWTGDLPRAVTVINDLATRGRRLGRDVFERVRAAVPVDLIGIDDRILESAGMLEPRVLRTLDAIHLATAVAVGDDLDAIVTYDERMADGARLLGLSTATPR